MAQFSTVQKVDKQERGTQKPASSTRAHRKKSVSQFDGNFWISKPYVYRRTTSGSRKITSSLPHQGKFFAHPPHAWDYSYLRAQQPPAALVGAKKIRGADLFCGCGGLTLGVIEACRALGYSYVPAIAVDIDPWALKVYARNIPNATVIEKDIFELLDGALSARITQKERAFKKHAGNIDILVAGPPCQGHSNLNNRTRRDDKRNYLYERVGRFAELFGPSQIIVENVPTIIHAKDMTMEQTAGHLARLGYPVDHGITNLHDFGVPQRRRRHVMIASLQSKPKLQTIIDSAKTERRTTVKWAIGDLVSEPENNLFDAPAQISSENLKRIKYLIKNDLYDLPNRLRPSCHQNDHHTYYSMYGRLHFDEPAQTITTGFCSPGQGRYIHPSLPRTLTAHEAARLQFFPDFFDFSVVPFRNALARMIGNAVPMKLSYVFAFNLLQENS